MISYYHFQTHAKDGKTNGEKASELLTRVLYGVFFAPAVYLFISDSTDLAKEIIMLLTVVATYNLEVFMPLILNKVKSFLRIEK